MLDILLAALQEYASLKQNHSNGMADAADVSSSKHRLEGALNDYIDQRILHHLNSTSQTFSASQTNLKAAESFNDSIQTTTKSIRTIAALNSAPLPPESRDQKVIQQWFKAYEDWYENHRKNAIR